MRDDALDQGDEGGWVGRCRPRVRTESAKRPGEHAVVVRRAVLLGGPVERQLHVRRDLLHSHVSHSSSRRLHGVPSGSGPSAANGARASSRVETDPSEARASSAVWARPSRNTHSGTRARLTPAWPSKLPVESVYRCEVSSTRRFGFTPGSVQLALGLQLPLFLLASRSPPTPDERLGVFIITGAVIGAHTHRMPHRRLRRRGPIRSSVRSGWSCGDERRPPAGNPLEFVFAVRLEVQT
jgi:hypothetical protein